MGDKRDEFLAEKLAISFGPDLTPEEAAEGVRCVPSPAARRAEPDARPHRRDPRARLSTLVRSSRPAHFPPPRVHLPHAFPPPPPAAPPTLPPPNPDPSTRASLTPSPPSRPLPPPRRSANSAAIRAFYAPDGPKKLLFYHQSGERPDPENPGKTVPDGGPKRLFVTSGEAESLQADAHALYVIRTKAEGVSDKDPGGDLMCGEIRGGALDSFRALLSGFYAPALQKHKKWKKAKAEDVADFVQGVAKFGKTLEGVSAALQDGVTLAPPPRRLVNEIELKPAAFAEAAKDAKVAAQIEGVLEEWCRETDKLLKSGSQQSAGRGAEDAGPDTELEYWRSRMAKFNSVEEQLKTPESRLVLGVSTAARSAAHKEWKGIDMRVADAANEAKDSVKYLTTLEKALEPMYASPADPRGSWTACRSS